MNTGKGKPMDVSQALLSPILDGTTKLLLISGITRKATLVRRQKQRSDQKGEYNKHMNEMYLLFESYLTSLGKLSWKVKQDHMNNQVWEAPEWKVLHDHADEARRYLVRVMNSIIP